MPDTADSQTDKSPSAFKTISEVSKELDIPQHVLRFWENKFPQISPLKRRGGRRYYRPEDVRKIKMIKSLLYDEGYTIKGAVNLLNKKPEEAKQKSQEAAAAAPAPVAPAQTAHDAPSPAEKVASATPVSAPVNENERLELEAQIERQLKDALHYLYDVRKRLDQAA